jgi:hypothetical protein
MNARVSAAAGENTDFHLATSGDMNQTTSGDYRSAIDRSQAYLSRPGFRNTVRLPHLAPFARTPLLEPSFYLKAYDP